MLGLIIVTSPLHLVVIGFVSKLTNNSSGSRISNSNIFCTPPSFNKQLLASLT